MLDRSEPPRPPEVCPCLAELLRTCVYPPSLHLRIEKVLVEACSRQKNGASSEYEGEFGEEKAYRLFLSDGVLVVQALLQSRLIESINSQDITAGNTAILKRFTIKRAKRLNGHGEVVFLGIADCDIVRSGGNTLPEKSKRISSPSEHLGEEQVEAHMPVKSTQLVASAAEGLHERTKARKRTAEQITGTQDSDSDDFETLTVDCNLVDERRKALHNMNINRSFEFQNSATSKASRPPALNPNRQQQSSKSATNHSSVTQTTNQPSPERPPHTPDTSHQEQKYCQAPAPKVTKTPSQNHPAPIPDQPQAQPVQSARQSPSSLPVPTPPPPPPPSSRPEPPYHSLLSLLEPRPSSPPLPPKNYPCTILAIISWISPSLIPPRPHSPFPAKRHIKIHDPSISARHSGVTVAVFCDAKNFRPETGTAGLFRGVVMQRTVGGDVILNAYERLMREEGVAGRVGRWFEDEAGVLEGLGWDVVGIKRWWEERKWLRGGGMGRRGDR